MLKKLKRRLIKTKRRLVEHKTFKDIIYNPPKIGSCLFLLRLRPNLREIRENNGKVQIYADVSLKQTYSKS